MQLEKPGRFSSPLVLVALMQGVRVWDWVRHGLGLPQYAEAFKNHSITVRHGEAR